MDGKACRALVAPLVVSAIAVSGLVAVPTVASAAGDTAAGYCGGAEAQWLGAGLTATYTGPVRDNYSGETGTGTVSLTNASGKNLTQVVIDVPGGKQTFAGFWAFTNNFEKGVIRLEIGDGQEGNLANPTCGSDNTLVTGVDFVCAVADDDNCQFTSVYDGRMHPWKRA